MVLFPEPDGPTIAVTLPAGIIRFKLSSTLRFGRVGYMKLTFHRIMSPVADASGCFRPVVTGLGASIPLKSILAAPADRAAADIGAAMFPTPIASIMTHIRTL